MTHGTPPGHRDPQPLARAPRREVDAVDDGAEPGRRVGRQLQGIDAWNATRHLRSKTATPLPGTSRNDRMDLDRRRLLLDRTHQALLGQADRALARDPAPMPTRTAVAVVAHAHLWYAARVTEGLEARGIEVVASVDNGAEALGIVIYEQPDLLLVGERLQMLSGSALLAEAALFSPSTTLAAQTSVGEQQTARDAGALVVFPWQQPPSVVAAQLAGLLTDASPGRRQLDEVDLRGSREDGGGHPVAGRVSAASPVRRRSR